MKTILYLLPLLLLTACSEDASYRSILGDQPQTYEVKYESRAWLNEPGDIYPSMNKKSTELCPRGYDTLSDTTVPEEDLFGEGKTTIWNIHCH